MAVVVVMSRAAVVAVLLPLLPLAGCGPAGGPAYKTYPADVAAVVELTPTLGVGPNAVSVPVGTTVEFRNASALARSVVIDPAKAREPADVALPEGAQPINSGEIARGQVWRHTFTVPGTYRYVGRPYYGAYGTTGTVEVRPF